MSARPSPPIPADAPLFEFPFDPPEWSLVRRDFMLAQQRLAADLAGWIHLGQAPDMGYAPDEQRLRVRERVARASEVRRIRSETMSLPYRGRSPSPFVAGTHRQSP